MPAANVSGEVFSLNANAGYEGPVAARAGAGGQLSVSLEAEACHGLSLEASARALADVNAAVGFLLAARGTAFAAAAAGVNAKAQVRPDVFERLGLVLDAAAYAEASAGGRLAVGLDFAQIARWAEENLDGLALELFLAFLEEIVLEAGVWGRVGVAAMAQTHVDLTVSLANVDDAGIIAEAGAAAGLAAGTGWDFYAGARFTDVRRFYSRATHMVTKEAASQAREALPADLKWGAEVLELALPTALECAYELGQLAALQTLAPRERMVEPLLAAFADSLRTFLLGKATEGVPALLEPLIDRLGAAILGEELGDNLEEVRERFDALDGYIQANLGREVELEDVPVLGGFIVDLADAALPEESDRWRDAAAVLWTGLACLSGLDRPLAHTSASAGALGGVATSAQLIAFPPPPSFVMDAYRDRLGRTVTEVQLGDAIDFLVDAVAGVLGEVVPAAGIALDELAARFEVTVGELVGTGLTLTFGGDLTAIPAYTKVRDALEDWFERVLEAEVIPALRLALGPQSDDYVTEVAAPSLASLSTFVLVKLDALVGGIPADDESPFLDKLSAGCSAVAYRIFARNALFLDHVLFEHVLDSLERAFEDLETAVQADPGHVIADTLRSQLPALHAGNPTLLNPDVDAVTDLVATMAGIGRDAVGVRVWRQSRRDRLRRLKKDAVLGIEGDAAFQDRSAVEDLLSALVLCEHVPNEASLAELTELLGEVLVDVANVVVPRALSAWSTFLLRITRSIVEEIDRAARELLEALAAAVDAALRELERWGRALQDAIAAAEQATIDLREALREIEDTLESNELRRTVKNALLAQGAAEAERFVRALDSDPDTEALGEDEAVTLAVGAFHLAFATVEPAIDLALDAAEAVAGRLADVISGALDAADALEAIVAAVLEAALDALTGGLEDLGVSLPAELSAQDVADAISDALPTGLLLLLLDHAVAMSQANDRALADQADAERRKAAAEDAHRLSLEEEAAAQPAGPIRVVIGSPVAPPPDIGEAFVHGPEIPVLIRVEGTVPSFFSSGASRRVRLAVNGRDVPYRADDWVPGPSGFEYREPLVFPEHGVEPGVNVLEVSVIDGLGAIIRHTAAFFVDPNAPSLRGTIEVDAALSVFDPPGDDHERSEQERVAFRWGGRRTLPIEGWRVQDHGGRHSYVFENVALDPGTAVVLHTGGDPGADTAIAAHWGRRAAVWNNREGDTVLLIDNAGFVRATFVVPPRARSR